MTTGVLEPTDFACIIDEIENLHNLQCDTEITAHMYDLYLESMYEPYTLFDLISLFNSRRIIFNCALNKREIIKFILKNKLDIPYPSHSEETRKTIYYIDKKCGLWIGGGLQQIKIKYDDIFKIDNKNYKICCIKPLPYNKFKFKYEHTIILKDIEDPSQNLKMTSEKFINILDTKNITIIHSMYIENLQELYKMWHLRYLKWGQPKLQSDIDIDDDYI